MSKLKIPAPIAIIGGVFIIIIVIATLLVLLDVYNNKVADIIRITSYFALVPFAIYGTYLAYKNYNYKIQEVGIYKVYEQLINMPEEMATNKTGTIITKSFLKVVHNLIKEAKLDTYITLITGSYIYASIL